MKRYPFSSTLKSEFSDYINLRKAQGHSVSGNAILFSLDLYLQKTNHQSKELASLIIDGWISDLPKNMHVNTKIVYISHYSGFARYLTTLGIPAFIPERPSGESSYVPYIFTEEEINQLISVADNLVFTKKLILQFPVIIRLLYGCGMRVNEVLGLRMSAVDLNDGIMIVRNGKGSKERYIPLQDGMTEILKNYCLAREKEPFSDELLFENTKGEKHSLTWVRSNFVRCLEGAEISKPILRKSARNICPHCLLYTFAVHSFHKQEQLGADVYATAPLLSAYMGHSTFRDTEYYLRLTDEVGRDIISKGSSYAKVFPEVPV